MTLEGVHMLPSNAMAFKEWAVVCAALGSGQQSLILRKGGIHEGRGGFRVAHPEFWLFPTGFHQSLDILLPADKFSEFLLTKQMRLFPEREAIVTAVFGAGGHFDAEQWIDRLTGDNRPMTLSRNNLYRTLKLLEEAGMIRKTTAANDREVYEPTYVHLAPAAATVLNQVQRPPEGTLVLREYVVVERVFELHDESRLAALSPWHIWSMSTVRQRFHYKTPGLFALLVRTYRLTQPVAIEDLPAFAGCRSWVELPRVIETGSLTPVLSDDAHRERMSQLESLFPTA